MFRGKLKGALHGTASGVGARGLEAIRGSGV